MVDLPILYSFRRCPYAMRARMALVMAGINVSVREIKLSDKPELFLETSPKGTVPVLLLPDTTVIDESLDIIDWAFQQCDSKTWSWQADHELITENDSAFIVSLRQYKYFERYPESTQAKYRDDCMFFVTRCEKALNQHSFLLSDTPSFVDIALFPFVRQFAMVDENWFDNNEFHALKKWLSFWQASEYCITAMKKHPVWKKGCVESALLD